MGEKQPPVRLEPCDLPPEGAKPTKFTLQRRDGEVVCCWLCEQKVATKPFENGFAERGCPRSVDLCEPCSGLHHSNAAFFPSQYPHLTLFRDLMAATRAIVRAELNRARASG